MAVLYYPQRFYDYYLFIFSFFLCVYTGYYSDPVPAALKAEGAAGGGGPAIAPPPGPRFHPPSSCIKRLYSASAALYLGEPPLVTPQISRMIFALPQP